MKVTPPGQAKLGSSSPSAPSRSSSSSKWAARPAPRSCHSPWPPLPLHLPTVLWGNGTVFPGAWWARATPCVRSRTTLLSPPVTVPSASPLPVASPTIVCWCVVPTSRVCVFEVWRLKRRLEKNLTFPCFLFCDVTFPREFSFSNISLCPIHSKSFSKSFKHFWWERGEGGCH